MSCKATEREWFRIARQLRDSLLNIAPRISAHLAAAKKQEGCFAILQREIAPCLEGVADDNPQWSFQRPAARRCATSPTAATERSAHSATLTMRCLTTELLLLLVSTTTEYRLEVN